MKRVMIMLAVPADHVNVMELVPVHHNLHVQVNAQMDKQNVRELKDKLAYNQIHAGCGIQQQIVLIIYVILPHALVVRVVRLL